MNKADMLVLLREICETSLPLPGAGHTGYRHTQLMEIARKDLSLARLAEAHFDACSILHEADRAPEPHVIYGVWAAERPGQVLERLNENGVISIHGQKSFYSGAGIVDRALITVSAPNPWLIDVDLRSCGDTFSIDRNVWKSEAFSATNTATISFFRTPIQEQNVIRNRGWYLTRAGFWHGACGPAACWAGGALGLLDYSKQQDRTDAHTLAHLGAMEAACWSMKAVLEAAGNEIDAHPTDAALARVRALCVRQVIEESCSSVLAHFGRAYGPAPLALIEDISRRYQELTIYLRQNHAERDLQMLGEVTYRKAKRGVTMNTNS